MAKVLQIDMGDGTRWHVPAQIIAEQRADYYAQKDAPDSKEAYDSVYRDEIEAALADANEIFDWAANNTNWEDVKAHAVQVPLPPKGKPDYDKMYNDARLEVIEAGQEQPA